MFFDAYSTPRVGWSYLGATFLRYLIKNDVFPTWASPTNMTLYLFVTFISLNIYNKYQILKLFFLIVAKLLLDGVLHDILDDYKSVFSFILFNNEGWLFLINRLYALSIMF